MTLNKEEFRTSLIHYAVTDADRLNLIHDLCAIIEADERCMMMEEQLVKRMRRLLE